jgi:hypothetical protein
MKNKILGYVQAPNTVGNQQVKVHKPYVPYEYKCKGSYVIGRDGLLVEKDSDWDRDKPNASWE